VTPLICTAIVSRDCVVVRGLPGSGKSTFADKLATEHGYLHLEADDHFMVNGVYRFDPARVADAHAVVARDALGAMQAGRRVVIANTHVRLWEMAAIVGAARLAGKSLCFVECTGRWDNVHNVPEEAIARMKSRWESLPAEFMAVSFREPAESPKA
jgi:predicted kinase